MLIACGGTGISDEGISSSSILISVLMPSTETTVVVLVAFVKLSVVAGDDKDDGGGFVVIAVAVAIDAAAVVVIVDMPLLLLLVDADGVATADDVVSVVVLVLESQFAKFVLNSDGVVVAFIDDVLDVGIVSPPAVVAVLADILEAALLDSLDVSPPPLDSGFLSLLIIAAVDIASVDDDVMEELVAAAAAEGSTVEANALLFITVEGGTRFSLVSMASVSVLMAGKPDNVADDVVVAVAAAVVDVKDVAPVDAAADVQEE